jgi:hypothetical protein
VPTLTDGKQTLGMEVRFDTTCSQWGSEGPGPRSIGKGRGRQWLNERSYCS